MQWNKIYYWSSVKWCDILNDMHEHLKISWHQLANRLDIDVILLAKLVSGQFSPSYEISNRIIKLFNEINLKLSDYSEPHFTNNEGIDLEKVLNDCDCLTKLPLDKELQKAKIKYINDLRPEPNDDEAKYLYDKLEEEGLIHKIDFNGWVGILNKIEKKLNNIYGLFLKNFESGRYNPTQLPKDFNSVDLYNDLKKFKNYIDEIDDNIQEYNDFTNKFSYKFDCLPIEIIKETLECNDVDFLTGMIDFVNDSKKYVSVITNKIIEIWDFYCYINNKLSVFGKQMENKELIKEKDNIFLDITPNLIASLASLYGVIKSDVAFKIIKCYYPDITKEDFLYALKLHCGKSFYDTFIEKLKNGEYIIHKYGSKSGIGQKDRDIILNSAFYYYIPKTITDLLSYQNFECHLQTKDAILLKRYLSNIITKNIDLDKIMYDMAFFACVQSPLSGYIWLLNEKLNFKLPYDDKTINKLISNFANSIRLWCNYGFTNKEMDKLLKEIKKSIKLGKITNLLSLNIHKYGYDVDKLVNFVKIRNDFKGLDTRKIIFELTSLSKLKS